MALRYGYFAQIVYFIGAVCQAHSFCQYTLAYSVPTPYSMSQSHPLLHEATANGRGGHRPFLDVIFDVNLAYDRVRALILQGLTTADFDNLRQTCRSMDHCLMTPSANGGLRYPPDLIDKCHEFGLPVPPSLPPRGSCPNPPQCTVRIRACQYQDYRQLERARPHDGVPPHPEKHLVCEVCRRNWHDNIGTNPNAPAPNPISRHDFWRCIISAAHITLCRLCDQEQRHLHYPGGHDGCVCYHEYYKTRWLCQRCDVWNLYYLRCEIRSKLDQRRYMKLVDGRLQIMPDRQGPRILPDYSSWCPCGRQLSEPTPAALNPAPIPWPGNHHVITPMPDRATGGGQQTTKQCVLCFGYIVPFVASARQPTRRSARLADRRSGKRKDRRHTMLGGSGKAATRHGVNDKGFEVRGGGGWR